MATENNKYLNLSGLQSFWSKIKDYINTIDQQLKSDISDINDSLDSISGNLSDEINRATEAESALDSKITSTVNAAKEAIKGTATENYDTLGKLETAIKNVKNEVEGSGDNSVSGQISSAIKDLNFEDSVESGKYVSSVTQVEGVVGVTKANLPTYVVEAATGSFITVTPTNNTDDSGKKFTIDITGVASSSDLTNVNNNITKLEGKFNSLSAATQFEGVVDWDPATATIGDEEIVNEIKLYPINGSDTIKLPNGSIVIYGNKEYVLDCKSTVKKFVELGDTTAELAAINEEISNRTSADEALGNRITVLENAKITSASGSTLVGASISDNKIILTDSSDLTDAVSKANSAVQSISGATGAYADITVGIKDSSKNIGVDILFHISNEDDLSDDKLVTAAKVKSYVDNKMIIEAITDDEINSLT